MKASDPSADAAAPAQAATRSPRNRSMPETAVVPVLDYPDVRAAVRWLQRAFGFRERLRIADHRAQLSVGGASVVVREGFHPCAAGMASAQAVMVRVVDIERHHLFALAAGARIISPPTLYPYGECQYTAVDPGGHAWVFSETMRDADPAQWGGVLFDEAGEDH